MNDKNQNTPPNLSDHIRQGQKLKPLTVSVKTARQLLDIGNSKICELISEGKLRTVSVGRKRLVIYSSLEELATPAGTVDRHHQPR